MRTIETSSAFRKDFKREKSGRHGKSLNGLLSSVLNLLASDRSLPAANRDHPLVGAWKDHRDCHLKPDLVLIYRLCGPDVLQLVRLGSHSELFG